MYLADVAPARAIPEGQRERELDEIGLDEIMRGDGVVAIEWADRFDILPPDSLVVRIAVVSDTERELEAAAGGPLAERVLAAWSRIAVHLRSNRS